MSKLHNKGVEAPDKIIDEIKKKVGESRRYIDEQIEKLSNTFNKDLSRKEFELESMRSNIFNLNENFSILSKLSYDLKGISDNNKDVFFSIEKHNEFSDEIDALLKALEMNIKASLGEERSRSDENQSKIEREIRNLSISVEKNRESILGIFKRIEDLENGLKDQQERLNLSFNMHSGNQKYLDVQQQKEEEISNKVKCLDEEFSVFSNRFEKTIDTVSHLSNLNQDKIEVLKEELQKIDSSEEFKQLSEILGMKEMIQSVPKKVFDEIKDWKKQMELKMTRLEKKFYGD